MPATVRHALSMTTPDDPAYENQPQHWNQTHGITIDAVGSEVFGAFDNAGNVKFGLAAGSISASAGIKFSAGTLSQVRSDFTFSNANGLSFGLETNGVVTGSYTVPSTAGLLSAINVSAGTTSNNLSNLVFNNGGGVTFGLDGSTITAVHNGLTNIKVSAGTLSANRSDLTFSNANGVSFGLETNGVVTASVAAGGGAAIRGIAAGGSTATENTVNFSNSNGISFGFGAGANSTVLTASHNGITSQTNQTGGIYAVGNTSGQSSSSTYDLRTLSIDGAGIVSVGWSNGSFRISATVAAQTVQPVAVSGSNGSFIFSTLSLGSSNGMHFYTTNGSIVGSYTVPAAGLTQATLFATSNTTQGTSGTQALSSLIFAGAGVASVGITNGSVVISVPAGGGGGGTVSNNFPPFCFGNSTSVGQVGNGSIAVQPLFVPSDAHFDRVNMQISATISTSSNSSHAGNVTFRVGLYTKNGSTLSLASSGSATYQWTNTSNNSTSVLNGLRVISCPLLATLTPGEYWLAIWSRTSTTNANWFTMSQAAVTVASNLFSHSFMVATNTSIALVPGMGRFNATSTALPVSMAFSNITHAALRTVIPWAYLTSGTY